ncbi:hypothetical protein [Legionella busanensis]|nr:hypothetical protein [Legionella busanensis]
MFFKLETSKNEDKEAMEEEVSMAELSDEAMEIGDVEGEGHNKDLVWNSPHGPIQTINFDGNLRSKLEDKFTAYGCITVITNDGILGTLTHLDTETDIKKFISCLDKILDEHKADSETCLIGGNNKAESKIFLQNLRSALKTNNYQITKEHTGGSVLIRRHSILYQDRVLVKIQQGSVAQTTQIELFFEQLINEASSANAQARSTTKPF